MDNQYLNIEQLKKKTIYTKFQLRSWITDRKNNGLAPGVIQIGGRVFVDKAFFDKWALDNKKRVSGHKPKRRMKALVVPEGFIVTNQTPKGVDHGNDGICSVVTIPHRTGFFRRILNGILRG